MGPVVPCKKLDSHLIQIGQILIAKQKLDLAREISTNEIWQALLDISNDRAPGLNGYTVKFFKTTWDIIGMDLLNGVIELLRSGRLLKQWNHTLLMMIPKLDHTP